MSPPSRPRARKREQRLEEEGGRHAGSADRYYRPMGFLSFVGRVLFTSIFVLSAYQEGMELGSGGGPTTESMEPKFNLFFKHVSNYTGMVVPHIEIKTVIAATVYLRAFGVGFFIFYESFGAFLLTVYLAFITPVICDFYNYEKKSPQFVQLHAQCAQNLALYGALLFFVGMQNSIPMRNQREGQQRPN